MPFFLKIDERNAGTRFCDASVKLNATNPPEPVKAVLKSFIDCIANLGGCVQDRNTTCLRDTLLNVGISGMVNGIKYSSGDLDKLFKRMFDAHIKTYGQMYALTDDDDDDQITAVKCLFDLFDQKTGYINEYLPHQIRNRKNDKIFDCYSFIVKNQNNFVCDLKIKLISKSSHFGKCKVLKTFLPFISFHTYAPGNWKSIVKRDFCKNFNKLEPTNEHFTQKMLMKTILEMTNFRKEITFTLSVDRGRHYLLMSGTNKRRNENFSGFTEKIEKMMVFAGI